MMAARVAAEITKDEGVEVRTEKGGLGELSVDIDGERRIDTNRLWYPMPSRVVAKIRAALAGETT
jgi:hypothetical protein